MIEDENYKKRADELYGNDYTYEQYKTQREWLAMWFAYAENGYVIPPFEYPEEFMMNLDGQIQLLKEQYPQYSENDETIYRFPFGEANQSEYEQELRDRYESLGLNK